MFDIYHNGKFIKSFEKAKQAYQFGTMKWGTGSENIIGGWSITSRTNKILTSQKIIRELEGVKMVSSRKNYR